MQYSYMSSISIATPANMFSQEQAIKYLLVESNCSREEQLKVKRVFKTSGIDWRYSVIGDYNGAESYMKQTGQNQEVNVHDRMFLYKKHALPLAERVIQESLKKSSFKKEQVTNLITVSCTGLYAPGIDVGIIEAINLNPEIERLNIAFMGCQAAINAIKAADSICRASENAVVLIVCVELCTLHFQRSFDDDNILANALFGDGASAIIVSSVKPDQPALIPLKFHSQIIPKGKNDLTWNITPSGFKMQLSSYIPELISSDLNNFCQNLLSNNTGEEKIDFYAVHPGGIRILDKVKEVLCLSDQDLKYSYHVMKNFGNMSSPTILFILYFILKEIPVKGKEIMTLAFGPGLSMESILLKTV